LDLAQTALAIAEEIQHPEWIGAARWAMGHVYHEIYAVSDAQQQLETAFVLARASSSVLYLQDIAASLALTYISQEKYEEAETMLAGILATSDSRETWGQRLCRCAEAELALATGKPPRALEIVDRLIASAANVGADDSRAIPRLTFIRGLALKELNQLDAAEIEFQAASEKAAAEGRLNLLRRIQRELGLLYLGQKRSDAAEREFTSSRAIVHQLASTIEDQSLRERFVNRALDSIPTPPIPSPRQIAKLEYNGLTEREREVAALISLGKSNREIAEELVVSERTAATHVSNILNKLSFSSRAQIAAWAVDNGLAKHIE
jgi:DNA-binding CsgD family transcriptional regulator